jgi:hypothetical protein
LDPAHAEKLEKLDLETRLGNWTWKLDLETGLGNWTCYLIIAGRNRYRKQGLVSLIVIPGSRLRFVPE